MRPSIKVETMPDSGEFFIMRKIDVETLFAKLESIEQMLAKARGRETINRFAAAYYISTGGNLPDDLENPPVRGLTNFDNIVKRGDIPYILSGAKKFYRISDLDDYLTRYREDLKSAQKTEKLRKLNMHN